MRLLSLLMIIFHFPAVIFFTTQAVPGCDRLLDRNTLQVNPVRAHQALFVHVFKVLLDEHIAAASGAAFQSPPHHIYHLPLYADSG